MAHLGDFTIGARLDFKFSTVGTTGAPTTLAGTPVISAYVGNSTTQITAGITLTVDFDGVTGLHNVRVVASVGNGYAAATDVDLVITTGTVGGTSVVGYVVGSFSIDNRSTAAIKTDTAAILVDTGTTLDARIPAALVSGRMDVSVGAMAANVLTATAINADAITAAKVAADVTTELQSGLATAANLATVAGYLDTEIAAILAVTNALPNAGALTTIQADLDDIQTRLPAALSSGNMKVDVLAISGSTVAADNLEESTEVIGYGTCTTGGSTTSVVASAVSPASAVNDQYNGRVMIFKGNTTAALAGQATTISDYDHASLTFTVVALTTAPASGDLFVIL